MMSFIHWFPKKWFHSHKHKKVTDRPIAISGQLRELCYNDETSGSETVLIVYLTMNSIQKHKLMKILHSMNNNIQIFEVEQTCIDYISDTSNKKILLVVDGPPSNSLLISLESLPKVDSLLVYSSLVNTTNASQSAQIDRIISWCHNERDLTNSIRKSFKELNQHTPTFIWYNQKQKTVRDLTKESGSFLFFQLFKIVLMSMSKMASAKQSMISICREYYRDDLQELTNIVEFDTTYKSKEAIQWYTKETFLYKFINRALRAEIIEVLYHFHFYMIDLSHQLEIECAQLRKKCTQTLKLYRGLKMSCEEIEQFRRNLGHLISPNGYLSTSSLYSVALNFAKRNIVRDDEVQVLFEYQINLHVVKNIVVADVSQYSFFPDEAEVLVDIGASFHIESVVYDENNSLWHITAQATDAGANLAKEYMEYQKNKMTEASVVLMLSQLFLDMGEYMKAENFLETILHSSNPSDEELAGIYFNFGRANCLKGDFIRATNFYNQAYDLHMTSQPKRLFSAANTLNGIGILYSEQGDYKKAEECFKDALKLLKKCVPSTDIAVAAILINLGEIQCNRQEYNEGLNNFRKAQDIYQQVLPSGHPNIALPLVNIGNIHLSRGEFDNALHNFKSALELQQKSLPNDHPDIAKTLHNLAMVYKRQGNNEKAQEYFQQADDIASRTLPAEHPILHTLDAHKTHVFEKD